jgi:Fe-S-cluster containining protein
VPAAYRPDYKEALEFYKTRGCKLVYADGLMLVAMEYVCPHLTPEGCSIYEDRPDWCRQYDGRKDPVVAEKCLWGKEK